MGRRGIAAWLRGLLDMVYPNVCHVCGTSLVEGETVVCLDCLMKIPRTNIHREETNTIHQRLISHTPINRAGGFFYYFRGTPFTRLILDAKYHSQPRIARFLAATYAREIVADGFFDGIDAIVPVPMHRSKRRKRGYNQTDYVARGIADVTGLPVIAALQATKSHGTQTRKNAWQRWLNSLDIYKVSDADALRSKHVLVVDDVVTTGATLLACCNAIHQAVPDAEISVLTLGVAKLD